MHAGVFDKYLIYLAALRVYLELFGLLIHLMKCRRKARMTLPFETSFLFAWKEIKKFNSNF
jgi:hypothetical protein